MSKDAAPLVEMRGIHKAFGGLRALDDVTVDLHRGEVVGIVGHNGAGKSTLIKILSGALRRDDGEIRVNGAPVDIQNPRDARALGIETIYQTLALADNLDASANIFLGRELLTRVGTLNEEAMASETSGVLERLRIKIESIKEPVVNLSGGQRQAVAIGRAIYFNAKILIMDEPTAALGPQETRMVGSLIKRLKAEGIGIFLISHDIHDVFDLADRITVLNGGRVVDTVRTEDVTKDQVLGMIILGKRIDEETAEDLASLH
ncbi:MAG: ATP-binding cassette domain-containing protein [Alphaproteobacteria bacterium]